MPGGEQWCGRLFVSYSRENKAEVYPLADALAQAGIGVWIDKEGIDPLDDFPARIRDGLARSHALLAWYSPEYAQSSYCQKELTAAWICAGRLTRDVFLRIFILNPEDSVDHIALGDVGRGNYLTAPNDASALAACVGAIRKRLEGLADDFAAVREFRPPEWHPSPLQGSARFVGRLEELWRIHTGLNPVGISGHEDPHVIVQLTGMGGVGKSLLAIEYAKGFGAAFPGGIYWLRAYGFDPDKPMEADARERERQRQIEDIAIGHDIGIKDRDFREVSRDLARKLAADGAPYLWVVDDLPAGLNQTSEFPAWRAPSPNGRTLITTRTKDYVGIGATVEIDVLEPDPAYTLLTQARKPQTEQEEKDARDLAEDLGRHALAVDVAGHFLLDEYESFADLRRDLAGAKTDVLGSLVNSLDGQLPGGHEKSIVATLLHSVRILKEEGQTLLRLACELRGGTPIPYTLAKTTFRHAFALGEPEAKAYRMRAVNQLKINSLATLALGGAAGDALSIHSLVRYTMQHGDPAKDEAAGQRRALREAAVSALDDLLQDAEDIRKHAALEWEVSHAQHLAGDPHTWREARLCALLGSYLGARGNYREALRITERALHVFVRMLGEDHPDLLKARGNIAAFTGQAGDTREALRLLPDLLRDSERVLGKSHPITLVIRNNIAHWTGETGDAREALRLSQDLLPDQERVLGKDHPVTLTTRNNIAQWTGETGGVGEALRLLQDLLPDRERVLGKDHPDTLRTRNNIAGWTGQMGGDVAKALRLLQDLLPDRERVLGKDHPETLETRGEIAYWTGERGNVREALQLLQDLLPDRERVLGKDHPQTLLSRHNIANWTGDTGEVAKALRLLRELLPDQERVLGRDHPQTLTTRNNIARWTGRMGDAGEALRLLRDLLPDQERVLGKDHPDGTLRTRANIAYWAGRTGDTAEELRLFQDLLPDLERVLGKDHPYTEDTRAWIQHLEASKHA